MCDFRLVIFFTCNRAPCLMFRQESRRVWTVQFDAMKTRRATDLKILLNSIEVRRCFRRVLPLQKQAMFYYQMRVTFHICSSCYFSRGACKLTTPQSALERRFFVQCKVQLSCSKRFPSVRRMSPFSQGTFCRSESLNKTSRQALIPEARTYNGVGVWIFSHLLFAAS